MTGRNTQVTSQHTQTECVLFQDVFVTGLFFPSWYLTHTLICTPLRQTDHLPAFNDANHGMISHCGACVCTCVRVCVSLWWDISTCPLTMMPTPCNKERVSDERARHGHFVSRLCALQPLGGQEDHIRERTAAAAPLRQPCIPHQPQLMWDLTVTDCEF